MPRAAVLTEGRLVVQDLPTPEPAAGEVRVGVTLAGVNYWEIMQRDGRVPAPERGVPGREGVGVVRELGPGVDGLVVGQRVAWSSVDGSYAEEVTGPAAGFTPVPDGLADETAAGLLFQGMTAHYLATDAWPLGEGDAAVVTAAAGGVGLILTQLLTRRGVRVTGLASTPDKAAVVLAAGAVDVLGYDDPVAERSVAAVFDGVGADVPRRLLASLRPRGAMVLYGATSGQESDLGTLDLGQGSFFLTRAAGRDYLGDAVARAARAAELLRAAAAESLTVHIGGRWPLADAERAWEALTSRASRGKLLVGG
ncbi:alcohol dehydrogenase catalytic domain-containing protein [Nocardioides sp. L-11A]|uniref:alcohol dehydrogenase catalytic domain-containing protein n=1 Tax=Nocardioides sp. L-11A TaxID=3043848 RepID=UPI00249A9C8F|nr:zinc-binding dehydrogenase [Nocardioides sp. L-11A]